MSKIVYWIKVAEELLNFTETNLLKLPRDYALGVCDLICDVLCEGIDQFNHRKDDSDAVVLWRRLARAWIRYKRCMSLAKQAERTGHIAGGTLLESIGVRDWRLVRRLTICNEMSPGKALEELVNPDNYPALSQSMSTKNRLVRLTIDELQSYVDSVIVSDDFFSDELGTEEARRKAAKESLDEWTEYWDGLSSRELLPARKNATSTLSVPDEQAAGGWIAE